MAQDIRKVVELTINEGKLDEFKQVANEFIQRVESSEPDTVSYEWFLAAGGKKCYILEWYRDSKALLAHLDNIRDLYEPLFKVSKITRLEVFGNPSLKVRQAHLPGTKFFEYWAGITRKV
jgi:quinol monooxygenase YgiN